MNVSFEDSLAYFKGTLHFNLAETEGITRDAIITRRVKNRFYVTILKNIQDKTLASHIKKELSCGGSITKEGILLQGDQKQRVIKILQDLKLLV